MKLLEKLLPKAAVLKQAAKRIEALEVDKSELTRQNGALWDSYNAEHNRAEVLASSNADLTKKIRKQTEADLLLVSMQIQKRILEGEKLETSQGLQALYAQQNYLAATMPPYSSHMGQLGGWAHNIGLGNVFGFGGLGQAR